MTLFPLRLLLDLASAGLIVVCLAYWWLGNLAHEIFGGTLFVLVSAHIGFNWRWYAALGRGRYGVVRVLNTFTVASLAVAMGIVLITSLLISRDLFSFFSMGGVFALREVHLFAAYWVVFILSVHIGTRWTVVMMACRRLFRISNDNAFRTTALRCVTAAVAFQGLRSFSEMAFGSKLLLTQTLDMWDFNDAAAEFFVNFGSIIALIAAAGHYTLRVARRIANSG